MSNRDDLPCVLVQDEAFRIVRLAFTNKETGELLIEEVLEIPDGKDAMGDRRWKTLTRREAGLGDWIRVAEAMKAVIVKEYRL